MNLKRFSDFHENTDIIEKSNTILEKSEEEIDLEEKTGDDPDKDAEDESIVFKRVKSEKEKEKEKEEEELDESFEIEILEDNIIKFNNGDVKKIYELLSDKYSEMDYFIRRKNNNLHIVKYNEDLNLNINGFVDSLFKFYSTKKELLSICENVKIKGNDKFSVVENLKDVNIEKVVNDLSDLLSKKK